MQYLSRDSSGGLPWPEGMGYSPSPHRCNAVQVGANDKDWVQRVECVNNVNKLCRVKKAVVPGIICVSSVMSRYM